MRLSHIVFIMGLISTFLLFLPFSIAIVRYIPEQQETIIKNQAEILGRYMEDQAVPLLLVDDNLSLKDLLISSLSSQKNLGFLFILDMNDKPIASTFDKGVPDVLIKRTQHEEKESSEKFIIDNIPFIVFQVPLMKGEMGNLFFGINIEDIARATRQNFYLLLLFLFFVLCLTVFGSYGIGRLIGSPLDRLTRFASRIPYSDPEMDKSKPYYTRETRVLMKAFKNMVSRIKKAEKEMEQFSIKMIASERLAAIGKLASGVAHEINNPLNGVDACLTRMNKIIDNPEKMKEYIRTSRNSLDHMKNVVRSLLDFSRPQQYNFQNIDVHETIEHALKHVSFKMNNEKLGLVKEFNQSLPFITGDRQYLSQLFVNIFLNSIDAMSGEGTLTIRTETDEANLIVCIKDSGSGIPKEIKDKVFEPFFSTKDPGKGTGLGLSVSYRIVQEHHGKIEVNSNSGIGTEFAIILPIQHEKSNTT